MQVIEAPSGAFFNEKTPQSEDQGAELEQKAHEERSGAGSPQNQTNKPTTHVNVIFYVDVY